MSKAVKGVLFDLDNTLIDWSAAGDWGDSELRNLELLHTYLAENKRPLNCSLNHFAMTFRDHAMDAWEASRTTLRAPHIITVMEAVLAKFGFIPDDVITMREVMTAYDWGNVHGVVAFPDVLPALEKLVDNGIKIGIVTNAWQPMWLRDAELKHHDLLRFFPEEKTRISAADVGYLKPHPEIFNHALKQLGTKAEDTLFVGDNPAADIGGAQKVGMRAILRVLDPAPPVISKFVEPDAAINNFEQLLLLVEDWEKHIDRF